jgi:vitamin B12 transporter
MFCPHAGGNDKYLLALLLLPVFLLPGPAHGQIRPIELEGFIVSGTPVPRAEGSVASHVTVLTGEDLRLRGVSRVLEALSEVPGLVVVQGGSYGSVASTFFRGAESDHVKVLVDGVTMNQAGGAFDFSGLSISDVERIEVVRGPASALYGSDAMAGVIHIITRRGRGPMQGTLSTSGGSYGTLNWGADFHGGTDRTGYSFSYAQETTDGILEFNNRFENKVFSGKLLANPDEKTRLRLSGRYGDRVYHFPTDGSGNVVDQNSFSFGEELSLSAEGGRAVTDRMELVATFKLNRWDGGSDDRADGPADTLGFYGYVSDDSFRRTTGDVRMNLAAWSGSVLSAGVEVEDENQDSRSDSYSEWGPSTGEDSFSRLNLAYYAHLVSEAGGWAGNLGIRIDDNEEYGGFVTYQAGLSYSLPALGTRFRGTLGRGLKEPTFFETHSTGFSVGNPSLEPEQSRVWDLGLEQSFGESGVAASLTWFHQSILDLIQYAYQPSDPAGPNYFNVAEARAQGLEVSLTAPLGDLFLSGGYTYLDSEVLDSGFDEGEGAVFVEGEALIRRPTHMGTLAAFYQLPRAVLSGDLRWTGARDDRDFSAWPAAPIALSSYALLGLGLEVDLFQSGEGRPGIDLRLRAENILDEEYQEIFGFTSPGRSFLVGLSVDFGG